MKNCHKIQLVQQLVDLCVVSYHHCYSTYAETMSITFGDFKNEISELIRNKDLWFLTQI